MSKFMLNAIHPLNAGHTHLKGLFIIADIRTGKVM